MHDLSAIQQILANIVQKSVLYFISLIPTVTLAACLPLIEGQNINKKIADKLADKHSLPVS